MRFDDRSDAELVELARAGWAPAFAVLLHRHAAGVHGAVTSAGDPVRSVEQVFARAMRRLRDQDPGAEVGAWLRSLAGDAHAAPRPLAADQLDAIWHRLEARWPDGHRRRRGVPWRGLGLVAGLVLLAAVVPALLLLAIDGPEPELPEDAELRATPLPEDDAPEVDVEADLPDFSFPSAGSPTTETAPPEISAEEPAAPEPEPEPEPAPPEDPDPAPGPEDGPGGAGDEDADSGSPDGGPDEGGGIVDDLLPDEGDETADEETASDGTDDDGTEPPPEDESAGGERDDGQAGAETPGDETAETEPQRS